MRSNEEYRQILHLWEDGQNKSAIARTLKIPRTTVRECISKFGSVEALEHHLRLHELEHWTVRTKTDKFRFNYAYMLGIYLGDGYIATHPRTYRLRIVMDLKYPNIIKQVIGGMQSLMPDNSIHTTDKTGSVEIGCYSNDWPEMFPQHGEGVKHERAIVLEAWQQKIVDEYPIEFVKGLIHSDGARIKPMVNGKIYSRYQFTNVSVDIRNLFCDTVEKLGLSWTHWGNNIMISRREHVAFLDEHIGAKS